MSTQDSMLSTKHKVLIAKEIKFLFQAFLFSIGLALFFFFINITENHGFEARTYEKKLQRCNYDPDIDCDGVKKVIVNFLSQEEQKETKYLRRTRGMARTYGELWSTYDVDNYKVDLILSEAKENSFGKGAWLKCIRNLFLIFAAILLIKYLILGGIRTTEWVTKYSKLEEDADDKSGLD